MSNHLRTVVYSVCTGEKGRDISALLLAFQNLRLQCTVTHNGERKGSLACG